MKDQTSKGYLLIKKYFVWRGGGNTAPRDGDEEGEKAEGRRRLMSAAWRIAA